ncbi:DUF3617 domain-containing protein [Sphingomonas sp.]|jgi:hypothetical protein|uniref:DUF3617 domain-containing protein n=1 Tax=Sphingomonas sp. TaxID=28214 RepID=UPI002DE4469A|nr:DUF3617 domain-containing protein [Sphingomonas sp.]
MRLAIALAALALAVASCNKEPELSVKNASAEQVAAEVKRSGVARQTRLTPGEWQLTTETKLVEAEGLPEAAAAQVKASLERTMTESQCLTPEQASRPPSEIFARRQNSRCTYDSFEMAGGKIKAKMTCPGGNSGTMTMTMDGTYTPTRYTMDALMNVQAPDGAQSMKMSVRSVGTRTGECASAPKAG